MYFDDNRVEISGVESDVVPTKLSVAYSAGSQGAISVESNSNFVSSSWTSARFVCIILIGSGPDKIVVSSFNE